jgi:hypothetical protein
VLGEPPGRGPGGTGPLEIIPFLPELPRPAWSPLRAWVCTSGQLSARATLAGGFAYAPHCGHHCNRVQRVSSSIHLWDTAWHNCFGNELSIAPHAHVRAGAGTPRS